MVFLHGSMNTLAQLPEDIMILLTNKLDAVSFNRFSAVCKAWHSIANKIRREFLRNPTTPYPWLMLLLKPSESEPKPQQLSVHQHHLLFLSVSHKQIFRFSMPEAYGSRCCGSDSGWLIMVVGNNQKRCNFLWNPFTSLRIELPPQATLPYFDDHILFSHAAEKSPTYIRKAMLFTSESALALALAPATNNNNSNNLDDLLVVAIYDDHRSAFCKPRDGAWTPIGNSSTNFEDFIFYHGKLYAITSECDLILVELAPPHPKVTSCNIPPPPEVIALGMMTLENLLLRIVYLVESMGELLMVIQTRKLNFYNRKETKKFQIFKLDQQNQCWIKVENLGHQILFIGTSSGFSLSALDYPPFKGNCIYFGDEYSWLAHSWKVHYDLGVYNLKSNTVTRNFGDCDRSALSSLVWFKPISW